ncbi:DUF2442 domain-containing protein [Methylobacterium sp. NEAU 140]|uniref:DUF2442 domain-containing protein n=1 Tax=Methylobacterium sp. NEAU 140 TaxID=3064945 RepID=UPI0027347AB3|nr:DUF2442 domain-containing protein [Methylobacterium sp. NEAU 140]MDP4025145.1 DUF2442 domain-containing protein [Methylobacterium sp. NEAU 140]
MPEPAAIACVSCIGRTSLAVTWRDGRCVCVELAGWIASGGGALEPLKDRRLFAAARVEGNGARVTWGDLAIEATHLWWIAAEQRAFSCGDLAAWQAELGLSNQEAAEFLGISLSAWNTYKAGTHPVPAPVAMVCRAALRDPILRQARYRPRTRGRPRRSESEPPQPRASARSSRTA